jgi:hypothetical protein
VAAPRSRSSAIQDNRFSLPGLANNTNG